MDLGATIQGWIDNNKQSLGNNVFNAATGYIQTELTNSGVELKNSVVPVAKQDTSTGLFNIAGLPIDSKKIFMLGALGGLGFYLFKSMTKKGR